MRKSRSTAIAAVACAVGLSSNIATTLGQTWLNPNSGTWSDSNNWIAGVVANSNDGTQVTFNAGIGESYVSTNDLADPFTLNAMNFNAQGDAAISLAGGQLLFAGTAPQINNLGDATVSISNSIQVASTGANTDALTISGTGSGIVSCAGTLSSTAIPSGTGGGAINLDAPNTTLNLSGGGSLFSLRGSAGTIAVSGGDWMLSSTQHKHDILVGTDDGPWALSIGETANQTTRFDMNGGTITAPQGFIAVVPDSVSIATFSNGAIGNFGISPGRFGVNAGTGTINVLSGAQISCRFFENGRQDSSTAALFVDGAGSRVDCSNFVLARGYQCHGTLSISNGGVVAVNGNAYLSYLAPLESFGGSAVVSVDGAGSSLDLVGDLYCGLASNATLTVGAGASVTTHNAFVGYQNVDEAGTLLVQGGSFVVSGQLLMQSTETQNYIGVSDGTFELTGTGGGPLTNAIVGAGYNGRAQIDVSGPAARFLQSGASTLMIVSGANAFAPVSTISISNGGLMQLGTGGLYLATAEASTAVVSVADPQSRLAIGGAGSGDLVIAQAGVGSFVTASSATLTVSSGGSVEVAGNAFCAPSAGAVSGCWVDAGTFTAGGQLHIGGSGGIAGGTAIFNITNGGFVSSGGDIAVYPTAMLSIGSGTSPATLISGGGLSVDSQVFYNAGTLNVGGQLAVGGSVVLSDAARDVNGTPLNKKVLEAGSISFTTSGFVDLNDNDAIVHNHSLSEVENFVRTGRNGGLWNGTMLVSTAAKNDASQITNLGVITGEEFLAAAGGTATFSGRAVVNTDVLVKFTYNGDTDFNGRVDGADYARIDTTFNNETANEVDISGWFNGDFDYNGKVDGADYAMIDAAFNSQGAIILGRGAGVGADGFAGPDAARAIVSAIAANTRWATSDLPNFPIALPVGMIDDGSLGRGTVPEPIGSSIAISFLMLLQSRRCRRRRSS